MSLHFECHWKFCNREHANITSKERAGGRKSNLGHDQIIVSEIVCISICERAGFKCAVCVCRGGE